VRRRWLGAGVGLLGLAAVGVAAGTILLRSSGPAAGGAPRFVDETAASGVTQRYDGPDLHQVGGGVAVFDCNADGFPDLYLSGGTNPAALYRNQSTIGGPLRFSRVVSPVTDLVDVNGAYPIDIDGDGAVDLVVLRIGADVVLRGHGDCTFEPATEALAIAGIDGHTTAFSATWEGSAGLPTLAIGHYLKLDAAGNRILECDDGDLLRPAADGSTYDPPIPLAPGYCALSMLFSDWDGSGRRDLRVSNDRQWYTDGMDQLWRLAPGEPPRLYTAADGWLPLQIWGMGIASQDLTGDGLPEVYLTSQGDNKLQTLADGASRPTYRDIALEGGVTSAQPFDGNQHLPSTAWHPEFADVNDDGFFDLFVSKGNVGDQADYATRDPSDLFLGQPDGTFSQAADRAGIVRYDRARGASLADLNLDGLPDLVVVNYGTDVVVWRNVGAGTAAAPSAMGHWLMLELAAPGPNRDAIGATLEITADGRTTTLERTIGGGHVGGNLGWIHLGLGAATEAQVGVTWPDGEVGPRQTVATDRFWTIRRDAATPEPWEPVAP